MKNETMKTPKTPKTPNATKTPDHGDPLYEEVRIVRDQVQEVLGVLTYLARDPELVKRQEESMRAFFTKYRALARVYLALSADRNMTQVGDALGVSKQAVQQSVQKLDAIHVIMKMSAAGRGDVWIRNPTIETVLHLNAKIRKWMPDIDPVAPTREEALVSDDVPDDGATEGLAQQKDNGIAGDAA